MNFENYEELINYAKTYESDIDKLKLLQDYFLKNVEYNYLADIAPALNDQNDPYNIINCEYGKQTIFTSEEEKEKIIDEVEKRLGNNFHLSKNDRKKLLLSLGNVVEPVEKTIIRPTGQKLHISIPGCDGSLFDCIHKEVNSDLEVIENGLIKCGVCRHFSKFVKKFCDDLKIKCYIADSSDYHEFNIIEIDGEKRVFDFTRMIGIRDDFHNFDGQEIDDWFNMTFQKMFEYKPNRKIVAIDNIVLGQNSISKDNCVFKLPDDTEKRTYF